MATKLQLVTAMYVHKLNELTSNSTLWQEFLRSASRNYKLAFEEQVLVHTQRPDATAVLELEKWNDQFGRWVNKGATGIAVVDRNFPGKRRLKYYFDISDTHDSRRSRLVPIWEMKPEYEDDVIETLEATFGELSDKETLADAVLSAAENAVTDNITDYLADLMDCREDSFLEELDELNVEVFYKNALKTSVAYMMMVRCGIDPTIFFEPEDFQGIHNFNTPDTATLLGTATSAIAETGLREIASTVQNLQKSERSAIRTFAWERRTADNYNISNTERSIDYGTGTKPDIQRGERIQNPRLDAAGGTRSRAWQVRVDAPSLPDESPQGTVQPTVDERRAEPAPDGNRTDSDGAPGAAIGADGEIRGRDGADESREPHAVDSADAEHTQPRGGNDSTRPDLQLRLFPSPEEQRSRIEEAEGTAAADKKPSAFSMPIPQEVVDEELTRYEGAYSPKLRIYYHYQQLGTEDEHIKFLKNEHGQGGHSPLGDGGYWIDNSDKGITFTKGDLLNPDSKYTLSWNKVSKRIGELIAADRYLSALEKEVFYPQYLEYLENREILRQKNAFIDSVADLPPAEKRDTLALRLADFLGGLELYEKEHLSKNDLPEIADTTNAAQIDLLLQDTQKTQLLIKALAAIKGATTDVFSRNHAWRFGQELVELYPRRPIYHLGDTVYIGSHEYEVLAFDDSTVRLYDTEFPLFNKEMPRAEYDRKIAENPANEHLMTVVAEPNVDPADPSDSISLLEQIRNDLSERGYAASDELIQDGIGSYGWNGDYQDIADYIENEYLSEEEPEYTPPRVPVRPVAWGEELPRSGEPFAAGESDERSVPRRGDRYEIQGRMFVVDHVDEDSGVVSLRDITFQEGAGFPIFRKESIEFLQMYDPIHKIPDKQLGYETWSEPATEGNAPERLGVPSDDVNVYLPPQAVSREVIETSLFDIELVQHHIPQPGEPEPTEQNTIAPAWEQKKKPARVNYFDAFPNVPMSERHNFKITDDNLGVGGAKAKFKANMDAIHLLHDLEFDGKLATSEQQEILSRYVGWGSLADAFKENNPGWENEFVELYTALSPEEYESARATTLNAHYTSPTVIKAIYKVVENMGFRTGNILDPGCGVGNFQGLLPDSMSDSKIYGIEIDPITGRIAQQLYL